MKTLDGRIPAVLAVHFLTYRTGGMARCHHLPAILDSDQGDRLVTSVFCDLKLDVLQLPVAHDRQA
ncbi:hypothetical protein N8H22_07570 [Stutzerimonas stutzeri]|uniref:hypothetical protein n=1 Tax=Stutzerimonas sp. S1 TaxID=3030652 RepID=UPI0022244EAA|nr:hypothetical protein [Stutzerimonas sp. S1]MCW3148457.1 hypothetical protein [Stutzerimonas sp. S1]